VQKKLKSINYLLKYFVKLIKAYQKSFSKEVQSLAYKI